MKKLLFGLVMGSLALAGTASAQMMGGYGTSTQSEEMNNVLQGIYSSQNATSQEQLDCDKVSADQFEKLGDAYTSVMLPNERQHRAMEIMMGGKGSANLRQANFFMGQLYLGCWPNNSEMMGGWSSSMMGNYFGWPMMGSYFGGFGWLFMILFWVLIIAGIILLARWLGGQNRGREKSALDILKDRYAKGEIDKKEFEDRKKDLV